MSADSDGSQVQEPSPPLWRVMVHYFRLSAASAPVTWEYHFPDEFMSEDVDEVIGRARETAYEFVPPIGFDIRNRQVFQRTEGEFLTVLRGRSQRLPFNTSVVIFDGEVDYEITDVSGRPINR